MDDQQSAIIKQLVDSLTTSLSQIVIKLESIHPVLNRIEEDIHAKNNIDLERLKYFDSLFKTIKDVQEDTDKIDRILSIIGEVVSELAKVHYHQDSIITPDMKKFHETLDELKTLSRKNGDCIITKHNELLTSINEMIDKLKPITKFINLISKPVGFIVFLLGTLLALESVRKTIEFVVEKLFSK